MTGELVPLHAPAFRCVIGGFDLAPRGKGSVRVEDHARLDGLTRVYMRKATRAMQRARAGAPTIIEPVRVTWTIYLPRKQDLVPNPRGRVAQPPPEPFPAPVKPDLSNVLKALEDCLTKAGVIEDDARIVETTARKLYVEAWGEPGVEVLLEVVDNAWSRFALGGERPA